MRKKNNKKIIRFEGIQSIPNVPHEDAIQDISLFNKLAIVQIKKITIKY